MWPIVSVVSGVFIIRLIVIGPILWGHSGPLCHALSLSLTSMHRRRATVATPGLWQCKTTRSGEWAQHFSIASCYISAVLSTDVVLGAVVVVGALLVFVLLLCTMICVEW